MGDFNCKDTVKEFSQKKGVGSTKRLLASFDEIGINNGNIVSSALIIIISFIVSFVLTKRDNSIVLMTDIVNLLLGLEVAVFSCIFAVFAIIVSLMSDGYMKRLASIKESKNNKSYLNKMIEYFNSILFLYFIGILSSTLFLIFVMLFGQSLSTYICLSNNGLYEGALIFFVWIYFSYNFRIIFEIKSMIYNAQFFLEANIIDRFLKFIEHENNKS